MLVLLLVMVLELVLVVHVLVLVLLRKKTARRAAYSPCGAIDKNKCKTTSFTENKNASNIFTEREAYSYLRRCGKSTCTKNNDSIDNKIKLDRERHIITCEGNNNKTKLSTRSSQRAEDFLLRVIRATGAPRGVTLQAQEGSAEPKQW